MEQHSLHIEYSYNYLFIYSHILGVVLFSLYLACKIIKKLTIKTNSYNLLSHEKLREVHLL